MKSKPLPAWSRGRFRGWIFVSAVAALTGCGGGGSSVGTSEAAALARLNDTGVSAIQCFAAGSDALLACDSAQVRALSPLQDGALGRDATAATNASGDGKLGFQFSAVAGGCVRDEVTGLVWEPKPADGGLRDHTLRYTNFGDRRPGTSIRVTSPSKVVTFGCSRNRCRTGAAIAGADRPAVATW